MLEFKLSNQVVDEDYLNKNYLKKHSFVRPYGGIRLNFENILFILNKKITISFY